MDDRTQHLHSADNATRKQVGNLFGSAPNQVSTFALSIPSDSCGRESLAYLFAEMNVEKGVR